MSLSSKFRFSIMSRSASLVFLSLICSSLLLHLFHLPLHPFRQISFFSITSLFVFFPFSVLFTSLFAFVICSLCFLPFSDSFASPLHFLHPSLHLFGQIPFFSIISLCFHSFYDLFASLFYSPIPRFTSRQILFFSIIPLSAVFLFLSYLPLPPFSALLLFDPMFVLALFLPYSTC